jgi:hypothetical protein
LLNCFKLKVPTWYIDVYCLYILSIDIIVRIVKTILWLFLKSNQFRHTVIIGFVVFIIRTDKIILYITILKRSLKLLKNTVFETISIKNDLLTRERKLLEDGLPEGSTVSDLVYFKYAHINRRRTMFFEV